MLSVHDLVQDRESVICYRRKPFLWCPKLLFRGFHGASCPGAPAPPNEAGPVANCSLESTTTSALRKATASPTDEAATRALNRHPRFGFVSLFSRAARGPLKSAGYWDDERDCIPDDLVGGLRIVAREFAAWKLCDDCRAATRRPKVCSRCGGVIIERHAAPAKRGAEDELRAELEAEGAYGE